MGAPTETLIANPPGPADFVRVNATQAIHGRRDIPGMLGPPTTISRPCGAAQLAGRSSVWESAVSRLSRLRCCY